MFPSLLQARVSSLSSLIFPSSQKLNISKFQSLIFPSSQKQNKSKFQFNPESEGHRFVSHRIKVDFNYFICSEGIKISTHTRKCFCHWITIDALFSPFRYGC